MNPFGVNTGQLDEQTKKLMLYSILGNMGQSLLQPQQGNFLTGIGNAMGAGAQAGTSLLGNLGEYQNKQRELARQASQDERQRGIDEVNKRLQDAQIGHYNAQSEKLRQPILPSAADLKERRDAENERRKAIGLQNVGLLQNPAHFGGMGPEDERTARGSVMEAATQYGAGKELQDYLNSIKPAAPKRYAPETEEEEIRLHRRKKQVDREFDKTPKVDAKDEYIKKYLTFNPFSAYAEKGNSPKMQDQQGYAKYLEHEQMLRKRQDDFSRRAAMGDEPMPAVFKDTDSGAIIGKDKRSGKTVWEDKGALTPKNQFNWKGTDALSPKQTTPNAFTDTQRLDEIRAERARRSNK